MIPSQAQPAFYISKLAAQIFSTLYIVSVHSTFLIIPHQFNLAFEWGALFIFLLTNVIPRGIDYGISCLRLQSSWFLVLVLILSIATALADDSLVFPRLLPTKMTSTWTSVTHSHMMYMAKGGYSHGCIVTGEAMIFLFIQEQAPENVYFYFSDPSAEVSMHLSCTACQYLPYRSRRLSQF